MHLQSPFFSAALNTERVDFCRCTNQWSLSRPLLALILICEKAYSAWKEQTLSSLAAHPQRQQKLGLAFDKLTADIPRGRQANLDVKTRDRFTQNLSQVHLKRLFTQASSLASPCLTGSFGKMCVKSSSCSPRAVR